LRQGREWPSADVDGAIGRRSTGRALRDPCRRRRRSRASSPGGHATQAALCPDQAQDHYLRTLERLDAGVATGPAGTGKTYLAVAYAAMLLERRMVDKLILSRPAVEAGERLGFLPGDMKEKVDPYLRPLYDALYDMCAREGRAGARDRQIEVAPARLHARAHAGARVVILDEAQNTTSHADEDVSHAPRRELRTRA
jgi:phosphate starvation-inducible PhoH-like protein